ncbi:hypothetical protein NNJEOMEG_03067 [Fundidesulfovibrio magnetotacticus]|uniref:FecR protein domain-containing protein n=1 Tax=Fundidesulfovibrio magnetotacticus TaxID=2730080 RepID=A0A6V8LYX6_9BACT|nr:FecR family protein [Fundidesulfovibrio magnetotacticus]GFK95209.1 hypothetical protein NNJEOMEG_03067 [Fundidesulfovibrio magnetotacticus]
MNATRASLLPACAPAPKAVRTSVGPGRSPAAHAPAHRTALLAALFLALAAALLVAAAPARADRSGDPVGTITRVQGPVFLEETGGRRLLAAGEPLHEGDALVTGSRARAELTFLDASVVTLSEDTALTVRSFDIPKGQARFEMLRGAFRAVTGSITRPEGADFRVLTPLAAIGIRGTDFWGGFFTPEELGVFLASGKSVAISNTHGTRVITRPGEGVTVTLADPWPTRPVKWREAKVRRAVRLVTFEEDSPK